MSIELNTIAPKKWVANYSGAEPTIDITDGVRVGDTAIDTSVVPNTQWINILNTDGAPVWAKIPVTLIRSTSVTTTTSDFDKVLLCTGTFTVNIHSGVGATDVTTIKSLTGTITLDGFGTETIEGSLTQTISVNESLTIAPLPAGGWVVI